MSQGGHGSKTGCRGLGRGWVPKRACPPRPEHAERKRGPQCAALLPMVNAQASFFADGNKVCVCLPARAAPAHPGPLKAPRAPAPWTTAINKYPPRPVKGTKGTGLLVHDCETGVCIHSNRRAAAAAARHCELSACSWENGGRRLRVRVSSRTRAVTPAVTGWLTWIAPRAAATGYAHWRGIPTDDLPRLSWTSEQ